MKTLLKFVFLILFLSQIQGEVRVVSPQKVLDKYEFGYKGSIGGYSIADFGYVPYGSQFQFPIKIASPYDGCKPLQEVQLYSTQKSGFILLISKEGKCSAVQKVRNAQKIGAKMVIIAEDQEEEHANQVILLDDGTGKNITISTILINEKQGENLHNAIKEMDKEKQDILIDVKYSVKKADKLEVKLFIDIENKDEMEFLHNMFYEYMYLMNYINIIPIYYNEECKSCKGNFDQPIDNCLGGGRYCVPSKHKNIDSRDLLQEQIRQLCLWEQGDIFWWIYIKDFFKYCTDYIGTEYKGFQACTDVIETQNLIGYQQSWDKYHKCVDESYITEQTQDLLIAENKELKKNASLLQKHSKLLHFPQIFINNRYFKGALQTKNLMEAMCAVLNDPPLRCTEFNDHSFEDKNDEIVDKEPTKMDDHKKALDEKSKISTTWVVIITLSSCFTVMGLAFCGFKLYQKYYGTIDSDDVKVQELVSQYVQFYETKEKNQKLSKQQTNDLDTSINNTNNDSISGNQGKDIELNEKL